MRQKILPILFPVFFLGIILAVLFYWLFFTNNQPVYLVEENRSAATFPGSSLKDIFRGIRDVLKGEPLKDQGVYFNQVFDQSIQKKVELWANDRFPLRLTAIKAAKAVDRGLISLAYMFLNDTAIPADTHSGYYVMRDQSLLFGAPKEFNVASKKVINDGISNYEVLIREAPGLNFYILYIQRIEDAGYHPLIQYFTNADNGRGIQYFESKMPRGLVLEKMIFSSFEDYVNSSFSTDHHWNIQGACQGYDQVYSMLAINYPDIPPRRECNEFITLPGVEFLGAYARETLYPIETEKFDILNMKLPSYQIFLDGVKVQPTKIDQYLKGEFSRNPYINHYAKIYGSLADPLEYYFPDNPPRNLLLIGASFRKPIEPLVASHYSHTYIIDPRYQESFSLADFLKTHQVDDLLILGHDSTVYGYDHWHINP